LLSKKQKCQKRNVVVLDLSIVSITSSCTARTYPHGPVSDTP